MSHGVNFLSAHDDQGMMAFREQTPSRDEEAYEQLLGQVGDKAALTILQKDYKDKEKKGNKMRVFQMVQNAKKVLGDNRFDDKVKFPVRKLLDSLHARYDDAETRIGGEVTLTAADLGGAPAAANGQPEFKPTPLPLDSWDEEAIPAPTAALSGRSAAAVGQPEFKPTPLPVDLGDKEVIPPAKPVVQKAAQAASAPAAPNLNRVLAACTRANVEANLRASGLPNAAVLADQARTGLLYVQRAEDDPRAGGRAFRADLVEAIQTVSDETLRDWFKAQVL
jgi:hypothetical protein